MSSPTPSPTFIIPPKPAAEARPFVLVPPTPEDREKLEPHWHPTIDSATD